MLKNSFLEPIVLLAPLPLGQESLHSLSNRQPISPPPAPKTKANKNSQCPFNFLLINDNHTFGFIYSCIQLIFVVQPVA